MSARFDMCDIIIYKHVPNITYSWRQSKLILNQEIIYMFRFWFFSKVYILTCGLNLNKNSFFFLEIEILFLDLQCNLRCRFESDVIV